MRAVLAVAGIMMMAAVSVLAEEEWPLRLEEIWETPAEGEEAFAEGFPPPEIKAVLADTSIPQEDKEWLLNQIRHWAAYRTKKLWLDDGTTVDIPAVKPGDKVSTFTMYASRNMKHWLVRAMRYEGPEVPPEPEYPGSLTREFVEAKGRYVAAIRQQRAHWREVFMDVEGRIYWEKEFGPYDTYLEDRWSGHVEGYVSDDGEVVVKRGGGRSWFCGKDGECIERDGLGGGEAAALSADGSTFVVHGGTRFHPTTALNAYGSRGEHKWNSEPVEGRALWPIVVGVADSGQAAVFSAGRQDPGTHAEWSTHLVGARGETVKSYEFGEHPRAVGFLPEGDRLVVATARAVRMLDVRDGSEIWQHRTVRGWPGRMEQVSVAGRLAVVSAYGDARCTPTEGELYVFDADGELLYHGKRLMSEVAPSPNSALLLEKAGWLKFSRLVDAE